MGDHIGVAALILRSQWILYIRLDMDLRVLLFTLFLLVVVSLPALKADDLSQIDSPMMDLIEDDSLARIVSSDRKSDDMDPFVSGTELDDEDGVSEEFSDSHYDDDDDADSKPE